MALLVLILGVLVAAAIAVMGFRFPSRSARVGGILAAIVIVSVFFALASVRYIGPGEVGIITKNAFGGRLKEGRIIATDGEMGTQAAILRSGWQFWYWPIVYEVKTVPLVEIKPNEVGLVEAADGMPLDPGQLFAPEWSADNMHAMLDATHFLTAGNGRKGKQVTVLTPGKYPLNTELFKVRPVEQTEVVAGEVAVLKANFGTPASDLHHHGTVASEKPVSSDDAVRLAGPGEMGVIASPLPPGKYPINPEAYTITEIWTTQMIAHFSSVFETERPVLQDRGNQQQAKNHPIASVAEREITVRTSDGFTFPVDVRVEYVIEPADAPIVVARLGDDEGERFRNALNSAVRAIFRNNAEKVRALDYVQQRSQQESQSLAMLRDQMSRFGITITAVRIGDVGDERTLGMLLKTQTDREIAKQEQQTFQEQQKAAQQKKELSRTTQEAEEEKRLATAAYAVKIAEEDKKKQVIAANAEAESIRIKGEAQSQAYKVIAAQIGQANAALIEVLKIVGERQIQITPRVMVTGDRSGSPNSSGSTTGGDTAALIGTMLDQMVSRDEPKPAEPAKK